MWAANRSGVNAPKQVGEAGLGFLQFGNIAMPQAMSLRRAPEETLPKRLNLIAIANFRIFGH
jgi:hypothetical protein